MTKLRIRVNGYYNFVYVTERPVVKFWKKLSVFRDNIYSSFTHENFHSIYDIGLFCAILL